jgi:hypothetical protein
MGRYKSIQVAKGDQLGVHRGGKRPGLDTARARQSKPANFSHVPLGPVASDFSVVDRRAHALVAGAQGRATTQAAGVKLHVPEPVRAKPPVEGSLITHRMAHDSHLFQAASQRGDALGQEPLAARAVTNGFLHVAVQPPVETAVRMMDAADSINSTFEKLMADVSPADIAEMEHFLSPAGLAAEESIIAAVQGPFVANTGEDTEVALLLDSAGSIDPVVLDPAQLPKVYVSGSTAQTINPIDASILIQNTDSLSTMVLTDAEFLDGYEIAPFVPVFVQPSKRPPEGILKTSPLPPVAKAISLKVAALKTIGEHVNLLVGWTTERTVMMTWFKADGVKPLLTQLGLTPAGLVQKLLAKSPNLSSPVIKLLVDLRGGKISVADFKTAVDNLSEEDFKVKQVDLSGGMSGGQGQNPQHENAQAEAGA